MTYKLFYFLLLIGCWHNLIAQKNKISIGGSPEFSMSSIAGQKEATLSRQSSNPVFNPGFHFFIEHSVKKNITIRSRFGYNKKGIILNQIPGIDPFGNGVLIQKITQSLRYASIGVDCKAILPTAKANYYVAIGPYVSRLVLAKAETTYPYNIDSSTNRQKEDIASYFNKLDWGLTSTIGVEIPLDKKIALNAQLRYEYGLLNISARELFRNQTIRNRSIILGVGIRYLLP